MTADRAAARRRPSDERRPRQCERRACLKGRTRRPTRSRRRARPRSSTRMDPASEVAPDWAERARNFLVWGGPGRSSASVSGVRVSAFGSTSGVEQAARKPQKNRAAPARRPSDDMPGHLASSPECGNPPSTVFNAERWCVSRISGRKTRACRRGRASTRSSAIGAEHAAAVAGAMRERDRLGGQRRVGAARPSRARRPDRSPRRCVMRTRSAKIPPGSAARRGRRKDRRSRRSPALGRRDGPSSRARCLHSDPRPTRRAPGRRARGSSSY